MMLRLCLLLLLGCCAAQAAGDGVEGLAVSHTGFVLKQPRGEVLRGTQLEGRVVHLPIAQGEAPVAIRLASIRPDPKDADLLRHEFQVRDAQGAWTPLCEPNIDGETWGFPVALAPGHPGREGAITLTCASGAVAKCIRFGYKPWARGPHGENLAPYHAACVHMVRADYCGDGTPHTRNGIRIDLWDHIGLRPDPEPGTAHQPGDPEFEAGWTPRGAVCVNHTRQPDLGTTGQILQACPRLTQAPACGEDAAAARGALIYSRSRL